LSDETMTAGPYGTRTSSSTTHMCFTLGTSSSSYITCVTNWSGETGSSQRRRLDSLDGAMARILQMACYRQLSSSARC
jgi:hypothetical protein